jgi:hypothetical protein
VNRGDFPPVVGPAARGNIQGRWLFSTRLSQPLQLVQDHVQPQALDELHDAVVQAVLLADAEDRHDVGVVQLRRRPRLTLEAAQLPRVEQSVGRQHLDGHVPAEGALLRLVDDAHAAPRPTSRRIW